MRKSRGDNRIMVNNRKRSIIGYVFPLFLFDFENSKNTIH